MTHTDLEMQDRNLRANRDAVHVAAKGVERQEKHVVKFNALLGGTKIAYPEQ